MNDEKYAYRGTFTELGCALGLEKPINIMCNGKVTYVNETSCTFSHYCMKNVFFWHKDIVHVDNIQDAVIELKKIEK